MKCKLEIWLLKLLDPDSTDRLGSSAQLRVLHGGFEGASKDIILPSKPEGVHLGATHLGLWMADVRIFWEDQGGID